MSFELFLQRFSDGEEAGFTSTEIKAAFGGALSELEEDFWQVSYGDSQSSDLFLTPLDSNPTLFHSVSVHRPCSDPKLYESLWTLLGHSGTCLYFPGDSPPLSRDPAIAQHLPADMLEDLGDPLQLKDSAQIFQAVEAG